MALHSLGLLHRGPKTAAKQPQKFCGCTGEETTMKKSNEHWDLSIHDYNPNGICVIHVELNEAAAPVDWTYVYCL